MPQDVSEDPVAATPPPSRAVWRLRYLAVCVALTALAFLQDPGLTVLDTKVDLTVAPVTWLDRALHLWNPSGAFGQVQNQAYGYLWPMGPFFVAGSWLDMPEWVIQRLWWALLLCVAFTGVVRLSGRLGIGSRPARVIAGVAFALSPRVLTELGTISIEAWPTAVAPWVLVPLVGLAHGASLRRAVTLSALAVACAGGVNATAVLAVVPMALLWLATLRPLRRRLLAIMSWSGAVALATAWWVIPLVLLGEHSPRFLDYIETARSTTRITDLATVGRGTSHWLAYFGGPYGPSLPAGYLLATDTVLVLATLAVAALGLAGLARPGIPHRRFLTASLLVGLALVGMGHVTAIDGGVAARLREFLDGAGAPMRNVHKFDVVVRLPLALGLAHLIGTMTRAAAVAGRGLNPARLRATLVQAAAIAAVVAVATPAIAGAIPTHGSYERIPDYWHEAAAWLDARIGRDHVLVVPGARFPTYTWGRPSDEIIQPLMTGSWAVRNDIPLTPPSTIRLLDSIESVLATGAGSPGLADILARSGVRFVLLRSDLDYGRSASIRPMLVRQALARSPGLDLVEGFGPMRGSDEIEEGAFVDHGLDVPVRSLEVFQVARPVAPIVAYDVSSATTVVGGPEALINLAASGRLTAAPAVLAGDLPWGVAPGPVVITDSLRRREVAFGLSQDNASATLAGADAFSLDGPAHDYLPEWAESHQTVVRYSGIESVTAASSWAQVEPLIGSRPEHLPFAAVDGDPDTSWRTGPDVPVIGQWLEVSFTQPTLVPEVRLSFDTDADFLPTSVTVRAGIEEETVDLSSADVTVTLPGRHTTKRLRVVVREVSRVRIGSGGVGISQVDVPGVTARRSLAVVAPPPTTRPASVVLAAAPAVPSCLFADGRTRCAAGLRRGSEDAGHIDRMVTLPVAGSYAPAVWARPRSGPELADLLDAEVAAATPLGLLPDVNASSTNVPDPAGRPGVVLDGDPSTAWAPADGDRNPWIRLNWVTPRTITGLRLTVAPEVAATAVTTITVVGDDGLRTGQVDDGGAITFDPPMRTDEITIVFPEKPPVLSFDPYRNSWDLLPIAVGELTALPDPANRPAALDVGVALPCGSGPTLDVGGEEVRTALRATRRDLLELREVFADPCEAGQDVALGLGEGEHRIIASASPLATPTRVVLTPAGEDRDVAGTPVRVDSWSAVERRLRVQPHAVDRILAVRENVNAGWRATAAGQTLTPIVVDGWQQAWVLPAGLAGEVVLRFVPDATYRIGVAVGGATLLVLIVMALVPSRRRGAHAHGAAEPRGPGPSGWLVAATCGAVALLLVGGVAGAVMIVLGALTIFAWRLGPLVSPSQDARRRRRLARAVQWWLPVLAFGLAGWLSMTAGDDRAAAGPQLAALVTATALWLAVALPGRRAGHRAPSR